MQNFETALSIQISSHLVNQPPYSLRGITQRLTHISNLKSERTIDGKLYVWPKPKKYRTVITGQDINLPASINFNLGDTLRIGSIVKFWHDVSGCEEITFAREPYRLFAVKKDMSVKSLSPDKAIKIAKDWIFVATCPYLDIVITRIAIEKDEWNLNCRFELEGEEV